MPMKYSAGYDANGRRVPLVWGKGATDKIAEGHCREHAAKYIRHNRPKFPPVEFRPFLMPKPKFKVGQKVRRVGTNIQRKVLMTARNPSDAGFICTHTLFGSDLRFGGAVWENESQYEAVT